MLDEKTQNVIRLLANDALEATGEDYPRASMLLTDAVASLIVSRHQGDGAREIAGMLAGYIVEGVDTVLASREAPKKMADQQSTRLQTLLLGGTPFDSEGHLTPEALGSGSREDWERAGHDVCSVSPGIADKQGGTKGGRAIIPAAALCLLLGMTERLAIKAGAILPPGLAAIAERGRDGQASAHTINLMEIAIGQADRKPTEAIAMLADAIVLILLDHHGAAEAQRLGTLFGEYIAGATNALSGKGEAIQ